MKSSNIISVKTSKTMNQGKKYTTLAEVIFEIVKDLDPCKYQWPKRFFFNHYTRQVTILESEFIFHEIKNNWVLPTQKEVSSDTYLWEEFVYPLDDFIILFMDLKNHAKSRILSEYYNIPFDNFIEELNRYENGLSEFDLSDDLFQKKCDFPWHIRRLVNDKLLNCFDVTEERDMTRYRRRENIFKVLQ